MSTRWLALVALTLFVVGAPSALARSKPANPAQQFVLTPLPYAYDALEPVIDKQTMTFHHSVHHAAYVRNLNTAMNGSFSGSDTLYTLLRKVGASKGKMPASQETAVRNNGGGHFNHAMFWKHLTSPNSTDNNLAASLSPKLKAHIDKTFGSFDAMKALVNDAGARRFGSGWAWLCYAPSSRSLVVTSTANQDNTLMPAISKKPCRPILGIDVWEHAYYLKHGPSRANYLAGIWQVINWKQVSANYEGAVAKKYDPTVPAYNF